MLSVSLRNVSGHKYIVFFVLLHLASLGCSNETTYNYVPIEGFLELDDERLEDVEVVMHSLFDRRIRVVGKRTGEDGSFTLRTIFIKDGSTKIYEGAPVGRYKVFFRDLNEVHRDVFKDEGGRPRNLR